VTPQALAWAWLEALPARPFALLESAGPGWKKRLSLLAGEPLFVFEGRGARTTLRCGGRRWRVAAPPEQAHAALGRVLARRRRPGFWPLINAFGYEAGGRFERLPRAPRRGDPLPDWWAFLPGLWARWDPRAGCWRAAAAGLDASTTAALARAWGLPERALDGARERPAGALEQLRSLLSTRDAKKVADVRRAAAAQGPRPKAAAATPGAVRDSMGREGYCARVRAAQELIRQGDIYQANIAHRFEVPFAGDAFGLYRRLAAINPSPMAAYVDLGGLQVVSASPERLFRVQGSRVETFPIAGSAPRQGRRGERRRLERSAKDRAEHMMLVDLERNDLGRVCAPGSVRVPRLAFVESYSHVHHLVSLVRGRLRPGRGLPELLAAGFPGGSITGAPKIRCMEIIARLEGRARSWYTGSLGWWDPRQGRADLNILIRTLFVSGGKAWGSVGAGIVLDSVPELEWRETRSKAAALLAALGAGR